MIQLIDCKNILFKLAKVKFYDTLCLIQCHPNEKRIKILPWKNFQTFFKIIGIHFLFYQQLWKQLLEIHLISFKLQILKAAVITKPKIGSYCLYAVYISVYFDIVDRLSKNFSTSLVSVTQFFPWYSSKSFTLPS